MSIRVRIVFQRIRKVSTSRFSLYSFALLFHNLSYTCFCCVLSFRNLWAHLIRVYSKWKLFHAGAVQSVTHAASTVSTIHRVYSNSRFGSDLYSSRIRDRMLSTRLFLLQQHMLSERCYRLRRSLLLRIWSDLLQWRRVLSTRVRFEKKRKTYQLLRRPPLNSSSTDIIVPCLMVMTGAARTGPLAIAPFLSAKPLVTFIALERTSAAVRPIPIIPNRPILINLSSVRIPMLP